MLTQEMKELITTHKLGFWATVCPDGTPNVSPKGITAIIDDDHIAFGEIRSPGTIRNLRSNPAIEVNFFDMFARKAVRVKGIATLIDKENREWDNLHQAVDVFGELGKRVRVIAKVKIKSAKLILSPAYDDGTMDEAAMVAHYKNYYSD